jgi:hypothetical protein
MELIETLTARLGVDASQARALAGTDTDTDSDTDPDTDPPPGDCVSGATGDRAVRFGWAGSGAGSTACVV